MTSASGYSAQALETTAAIAPPSFLAGMTMDNDIGYFRSLIRDDVQDTNIIMMPAATADPITPATLGPMACIRSMF